MKKKYALLFSLTLILIASMYFIENSIISNRANVYLMKVLPKEVENTVNCTGVIKSNESHNVYVKANAVVESIFVDVGDKVKQGDNIIKVKYNNSGNNVQLSQDSNQLEKDLPSMNYSEIQEAYSKFLSQSVDNKQGSNNTYSSNTELESANILSNVLSPISGIVEEINISCNDTIDTSVPVAVISSNDGTKVSLSVNESQISDIKLGQRAVVTGVGFKNSEYTGEVTEISDIATKSVSTSGQETVVDVTVTLDENEYPDIKSGFTAKCKITTSNESNLIIVPYESVLAENDGREYVYKYRLGKAHKTYVKTGRELTDGFEILDGINFSDVIIQNPENVKDNQVVNILNSYDGDSSV